jgi:aminopeptidase N
MPRGDLWLDGEGLTLIRAAIDGHAVAVNAENEGVRLPADTLPDGPFVWEAEVEIDPLPTPRLKGCTCRAACTAPSARRRGSARSPTIPTGPM